MLQTLLTPLFIGGIGPTEMMVVFAIFVLLFGANKLPDLARSVGQSMGEFQRGRDEIEAEIRNAAPEARTDAAAETEDADAAVASDSTA